MYESYKMKCRYEFYRGPTLIYTAICHINSFIKLPAVRRKQPMTKKGQNFFNNPCPLLEWLHGKQQQHSENNLHELAGDARVHALQEAHLGGRSSGRYDVLSVSYVTANQN